MNKTGPWIIVGVFWLLLAGALYMGLEWLEMAHIDIRVRIPFSKPRGSGLKSPQMVQVDSGYKVVMGTFSRAVAIAPSEKVARACIAAAFEQQKRVEELMSYHNPASELNTVNREAYQRAVEVDKATFEVLANARRFSELSGGAFDVTIGALGDLWRRAAATDTMPTEVEIAEARSKVGYDKVLLDPNTRTVRFAVEGMRIDLGGIAKGYAVDQSVEAMKKRGAVGGMVDLGGNIRCFGLPPKGQECWRVGLQDPNVAPDELGDSKLLLVLMITDESVATSGDYRRFVKVQGNKESHIIDTGTGKGARKLVSDTIIAPDAITADALSTAVNVLGPEAGLALIESIPEVEAILIPVGQGAQPIFSSGAKAYVR